MSGSIASENFLTGLMDTFKEQCLVGGQLLQQEVMYLFVVLATIEIAMVLLFNQDHDPFTLLAKKVMKFGFFAWLIGNWNTNLNLCQKMFESFQKLGAIAAGISNTENDPSYILEVGIKIFSGLHKEIFSISGQANVLGILGIILLKIVILIIGIVCFAYISLQIFLTCVEFYIVNTITVVLLPFGINKHTSFLAEKAIGAIFSFCIKVMVLQFIMCVGIPLMDKWAFDGATTNINVLFRVVIGCAAMAFLTWKAPDVAQGLLSGSPSLRGGEALGAAKMAASAAAGVVTGGVGTAMTASGIYKAASTTASGSKASTNQTLKNLGTMARNTMPDKQGERMGKSLLENRALYPQDGKI